MSAEAMRRRKPMCEACGFIHGSDWARAVGLFSGRPILYRAASMPYPPRRATRAEAEADECLWRAAR